MSDVKLSDQLGAMAIIDSLYAQQIALEEHLDLPKLRQRIVQRIRDYYRSTGTDINDELIEQGVKTWFANRLRFQAPKMSLTQRAITYLYLTSKRWLSGLAIIILVGVIALFIRSYAETARLDGLEKQLASETAQSQEIGTKAQQLSEELAKLKITPLNYAQALSQNIITSAENQLAELKAKQPVVTPPVSDTSKVADNIQQQVHAKIEFNQQRAAALDKVSTLVAVWTQLQKLDSELAVIAKDQEIDSYIKQAPSLGSDIDAAALALSQGARDSEALIKTAYQAFYRERMRKNLYALLDKQAQQFTALPLSKADRAQINIEIASLRDLIAHEPLTDNIIPDSYSAAMKRLSYTYALIQQPLTLQIVDRVGEKSGVERTYDESGGKTWYMIVEAVTPTHSNFPMWVKDGETGQERQVETFGMQISEREYNNLKRDKQQDGHIDNPIVGHKPANQLSFKFTRPVMKLIITNW